jgi:hypothetical protein
MKNVISFILTILAIFLIYTGGMLSYGRVPLYIWVILMLPAIAWLVYLQLGRKIV